MEVVTREKARYSTVFKQAFAEAIKSGRRDRIRGWQVPGNAKVAIASKIRRLLRQERRRQPKSLQTRS